MDHGGGRSSSRLRDRLARLFRPGSLLRSTCNTTAGASSSSPAAGAGATGPASTAKSPPPSQPTAAASACSSSRALLAADCSADRDSFLASSRRDLVSRTESFSNAVDRLHRRHRRDVAPPLSRFSVDAPASSVPERNRDVKEKKSPRYEYGSHHHPLGGGGANKSDKTMIRMKLLSNPYGFSSSEAETDVFSSDDGEDDDLAAGRGGCCSSKRLGESAETFFSSSRSFSSDSSEFYTKKHNKKKTTTVATKTKGNLSGSSKPPRTTAKRGQVHPAAASRRHHRRAAPSSCDTCGVRDGFRPVVSAAEEQVRRGFAVVKRSRDPYADFRSSMVEMMVGRQLFGPPDMERLLRSYLSLNAPRHHPVILQAFSDIWVVVHGG